MATTAQARADLRISGTSRLAVSLVTKAAGTPPTNADARRRWLVQARKRIVELYRQRGYRYARAWGKLEGDDVVIAVDEGRVQLGFIGVSTLRSMLFRIDLHLPDNIYHEATLQNALEELRTKYGLAAAYHRVTYERPAANPFGKLVPQRLLRIYIVTHESFGWGLQMAVSSSWGIVPRVVYSHRAPFFRTDRLFTGLEIGLPFRKLFFEQDPRFQWVHGAARLEYSFPRFARVLAPVFDGYTAVSKYGRSDTVLQSYFTYRGEALLSLAFVLAHRMTLKLGGGPAYTYVFDKQLPPNSPDPPPPSESLLRYVIQTSAKLSLDRRLHRRDQRSELSLRLRAAVSERGKWLFDVRAEAQQVIRIGAHDLVLRGRGLLLRGDVQLWDEVELASNYMHAFFDNRYWVHEMLQSNVGFRFFLHHVVKIGIYHDVSVFSDLTSPSTPFAMATAFGPSMHFLLFDLFSLDIYYAFGFAPIGFGHNISFRVQNAF
ncbi:MAG: hypothetical protein H6707_12155 [Deltaproteobacteria bacterium]|nr:hypothetical protein [Deltaproteobacteria bacterium]